MIPNQTFWIQRLNPDSNFLIHNRCGGSSGNRLAASHNLLASLNEAVPAGGAGGVRAEPSVNAADVEAVVALRQHPHPLPGCKLGEADGALGVQAWQLQLSCIANDGKCLEGLLFNPGIGKAGSGGWSPLCVG